MPKKGRPERRDDLFTVDRLYELVKDKKFITFIDVMKEVGCGLSKAYQIVRLLKLAHPDVKVDKMTITYDGG